MKTYSIRSLFLLGLVWLGFASLSFAGEPDKVIKIYMSNNQGEITLEQAYQRLEDGQQQNLTQVVVHALQLKHIEQGSFTNVLGAYTMSTDKKITADNTAIFSTSPYQYVEPGGIFAIAQAVAVDLKQDSVAVFIPSASTQAIGNVEVDFASNQQPMINDAVNFIHQRLPVQYGNAFSIHLKPSDEDFNHRKVTGVEWLGSQIDLNKLKQAFPQAAISYHYGKAYLVYADGRVDPIV